jgi:hypothetical protein
MDERVRSPHKLNKGDKMRRYHEAQKRGQMHKEGTFSIQIQNE